MLTVYKSGLTSTGESELVARIGARVRADGRTLLFVPEQQTLSTERTMCDMLPPSAPRCFEVTNFTRFANTAFRTLGGISGEYCDKTAKSLLMWRTLTELSPLLSMTRGRVPNAGIVARAEAAVGEMQSLAISADELSELAEGDTVRDRRLGSKLTDLSMIMSLYRKHLGEKYNDITEDTIALAKMLESHPEYLSETEVYVSGFTSFTEPQYRLLEVMMSICPVTVALALPRAGGERYEYLELRTTERRLLSLADRRSVKKTVVRPDARDMARPEILSQLCDLLWSVSGEIDNETLQFTKDIGERVRIFSAETPFEECDHVAADIKRRVMEGARYSDFAIVAASAESYAGILDLSLERAGIPYFFSRVRDLSSFEAVKLIYTAYAIAERGFAREEVLTYMKCGLSGISADERDLFEQYVEKWRIDGAAFGRESAFTMNPRGYEPFRDEDRARLDTVRRVRDAIVGPLTEFTEKARAASTVREHATALFEFLSSAGLEQALKERSRLLLSLGEGARAEENSRLFGIICDALDRLVDLLGDSAADSESFRNQLSVVLSGTGFGRIPAHVDEVTFGSADMLRLSGKKHVYLIGVNEGEFPASVTDNSYFTDRDKAALKAVGLATEPDLAVRGARALYSFSRAFSFARESVTLLYSRRSSAMAPVRPAEVIERIVKLTGERVRPVAIESLGARGRLFFPDMAYELLGSATQEEREAITLSLADAGESRALAIAEGEVTSGEYTLAPEAVALIYKGDLYLSQSRLEGYLECPFRYFLRYNLHLDEGDQAELSGSVIGSFIHAILEDFFREAREKNIPIGSMSDEERLRITERSSRRFITEQLGSDARRERTRLAISRLCRAARPVVEGLCDEFAACEYVPTLFELSTEGKKPTDARPVIYEQEDGTRLIIRGKVDRVDTMHGDGEVFVRVVDYKTGAKEFSPTDIARGVNMQMFLYLQSIVETESPEFRATLGALPGERLVPAGVIYAKTSIKDAVVRHSSDEEGLRAAKELSGREGMVLDNETSLGGMNPEFTPLAYPETSRNASANAQRKYTEDGWRDILDTMKQVITDIARDMRSGRVSATPTRIKAASPCEYCSFAPVCRKSEA